MRLRCGLMLARLATCTIREMHAANLPSCSRRFRLRHVGKVAHIGCAVVTSVAVTMRVTSGVELQKERGGGVCKLYVLFTLLIDWM